jgi:hypothetical protein
MAANLLPPVPPIGKDGFKDPVWAKWLGALHSTVVTNPSAIAVAEANGFAGAVVQPRNGVATITLLVTTTGLLKGNGKQLLPAIAGTDYLVQNQSITFTGDVTGKGSLTVPLVLASYIGAYQEATTASSVTLVSNAVTPVLTMTLPAGDWEVSGASTITGATTLGTIGASSSNNAFGSLGSYVSAPTGATLTPTIRFNVSASANVYLLVQTTFTGVVTATGFLRARRVR